MSEPAFSRYIGIDYSGAETPLRSLKGLRVYAAGPSGVPIEVDPPPGPKKYWTRRGIAHWLAETLAQGPPALVGIDHGFGFPMAYFQKYGLGPDWTAFLRDFTDHWPTHADFTYVQSVRIGYTGNGRARTGKATWRRLADQRARAKSVFHFDVPGSVAKSTHAGLPWLLHLRERLGEKLHFWPFDGWDPPEGRSVVAEAYPSLVRHRFPVPARLTQDQLDAYVIAAWMQKADLSGELGAYFQPDLSESERRIASVEGWILGLP